jgi:type II secretory pathway component PulJ
LLEVMLAIAIFAGVLTAIYATWTSILRSSQVAQTAAAEVQRSRMAARALQEALLGAQAAVAQASRVARQNESYYSFLASGDPEEPYLSFVARLPESYPRGGRFGPMKIRRLTFNLERDAMGENLLVLRQTPLLFEPDVDEEENPLVLARNVQEFAL